LDQPGKKVVSPLNAKTGMKIAKRENKRLQGEWVRP